MDAQGETINETERARYASYARRGKRDELRPKTTKNAEKSKQQPGNRKKSDEQRKDEPSLYPDPDNGPDEPLTEEVLRKARPRRIKKANRKTRVKHAESIPELAIRKPTRPSLPVCRRVSTAISAPPKLSTSTQEGPRKRRLEMAPSILAKKVALRHHKSSREIAEELASSYGMPATERHASENIIRGMRAAQRQFCERIRMSLPLNRTAEDVNCFLAVMEAECRQIEVHDSDEFV